MILLTVNLVVGVWYMILDGLLTDTGVTNTIHQSTNTNQYGFQPLLKALMVNHLNKKVLIFIELKGKREVLMAGLDSDKDREQKTKNKKEPSNRYEIHRHNKNTNTTEVEYKVAPPVLEEVYKDEQ